MKVMPAIVLVTVYKEGVPINHVLPVAGTMPFDLRPGELASRLDQILQDRDRLAAAPAAPRAPQLVPAMQHRFTMGEVVAVDTPSEAVATESTYGKQPMPSKTSQLTKTGFLRSVFDPPTPANAIPPTFRRGTN
jgi:hypothetical protein